MVKASAAGQMGGGESVPAAAQPPPTCSAALLCCWASGRETTGLSFVLLRANAPGFTKFTVYLPNSFAKIPKILPSDFCYSGRLRNFKSY